MSAVAPGQASDRDLELARAARRSARRAPSASARFRRSITSALALAALRFHTLTACHWPSGRRTKAGPISSVPKDAIFMLPSPHG
jgi:hypothetical protein